MTRYGNGPLAKRLLALYEALQRRDTPLVEVVKMASVCGINPRQLLADHINCRLDLSLARLEA